MPMANPEPVVIYGSSLFSLSIEASLRNQPGIAVIQIDTTQADALAHLVVLRPCIIIVDTTDTLWDTVMTYLVEQPATSLIGLNPHTSAIMLLRGQYSPLHSMQQLIAVIEWQMAIR